MCFVIKSRIYNLLFNWRESTVDIFIMHSISSSKTLCTIDIMHKFWVAKERLVQPKPMHYELICIGTLCIMKISIHTLKTAL